MKSLLAGWWAACCGLMSIFLLGCPGTLDPGVGAGGMTGTANCQVALLAGKCAIPGCHSGSAPTAGLDLGAADLAATLVDHDTGDSASGSMCNGMKLLNSGTNPATGVLIDKITASTCGAMMPIGSALTTAERTCLVTWATTLTSPPPFIGEDRP
jgi:hypothetical protein